MSVVADPTQPTASPREHEPVQRGAADRAMRRILGLPVDGPRTSAAGARAAFQRSIAISAVRCTLMYLVFPFVLPAIGIASGVGPVVGLIVNAVAVVSIFYSLRRFFGADHPKRWSYAALAGAVLVLLTVLAVIDIKDLVS